MKQTKNNAATNRDKESSFSTLFRTGARHVSRALVEGVLPSINEGAGRVMDNIDARILRVERRILAKIISLVILSTGAFFLLFSLLFLLTEFFNWTYAAAFFAIGITVFVTGLLLIVLRE